MAEETKTGTIEQKSAYGIKIDGVWYNPAGKAGDYMKGADKGANVTLTLTGTKNDFRFIRVNTSSPATPQASPEAHRPAQNQLLSKEEYWAKKEERDVLNGIRISRHGALNTAIAFMGDMESSDRETMHQNLLMVTKIADIVLRYVEGDETLEQELINNMGGGGS
jgi:hypothetical protein